MQWGGGGGGGGSSIVWMLYSHLGYARLLLFSQRHWSGAPVRKVSLEIDHYLDDFIIVAPPEPQQIKAYVAAFEVECEALGVTLAPEKVGPSTKLGF